MKRLVSGVMVVAVLLSACGSSDPGEGDPEGYEAARRRDPQAPAAPLSAEVAADLGFIREEEKLARDVYLALQERWGLPAFSNISRSESQHMSAILTLLNRYGVSDPVGSAARGVFRDPELQRLHDALLDQGRQSAVEALEVGAFIEDFDIVDIRTRLASNPPADVATVYQNLMRGSRNHLRSFAAQLASQGATYTPTYLTQQEYEEILASRW